MRRLWLIVTGGYHRTGGQDRANLELARSLALRDENSVHLVGHDFDAELEQSPLALHRVRRPLDSTFLGERALAQAARSVLQRLPSRPIIISNGGNFPEGDVNWVHCVHAFWPIVPFAPPLTTLLASRLAKRAARRRELLAFRRARALIANSEQTRAHLISLGVDGSRVARVYFGTTPPDLEVREKPKRLIFIGALGWDRNKGLDRLLGALHLLTRSPDFSHSLTVVGAGDPTPWERMVKEFDLKDKVRFAGRVADVRPELGESELLVSPSRYEAYGLAVQDALVQGVPALVTRTAGIAERYPRDLQHLLVDNTDSPEVWARAIRFALSNLPATTLAVRRFASELCQRSWRTMAEEIESEIRARVLLTPV